MIYQTKRNIITKTSSGFGGNHEDIYMSFSPGSSRGNYHKYWFENLMISMYQYIKYKSSNKAKFAKTEISRGIINSLCYIVI